MVVSMDVGELSEACRALTRVVEETGDKVGAEAVDEDVLDRLVNAVTRAPADSEEEEKGAGIVGGASPNEGQGLLRIVAGLFENTILPRVSSWRIFRAYARLLTWQSRWGDALKACMDAYRSGLAGTMDETVEWGDSDEGLEKWREAVREVEEMVDVLLNFGPRVDREHGGNGKKWRNQGRSIVKGFMRRTRGMGFEDSVEWERLVALEESLRNEE